MYDQSTSANFSVQPIGALDRFVASELGASGLSHTSDLREESLPFTVRLVRNEEDLSKAVQIRHSAYARHLPVFAETLKAPESSDSEDGAVVLLAESKLDGSSLGTMRIQTNQYKPLSLEQSVTLPERMRGRLLAEGTRLAVTNEKTGRMVKVALVKAGFQFCELVGIEIMVLAARAPLDSQYKRLMFEDVYPDMGFIPMAHANNMPHRVMACEIGTARARAQAMQHPLFGFFYTTYHPDIDISLDTHHPFTHQLGTDLTRSSMLRM
jgi:hypothetical protein